MLSLQFYHSNIYQQPCFSKHTGWMMTVLCELAHHDLVLVSLKTSVFCCQTAETIRNLITSHNQQSTAVWWEWYQYGSPEGQVKGFLSDHILKCSGGEQIWYDAHENLFKFQKFCSCRKTTKTFFLCGSFFFSMFEKWVNLFCVCISCFLSWCQEENVLAGEFLFFSHVWNWVKQISISSYVPFSCEAHWFFCSRSHFFFSWKVEFLNFFNVRLSYF